MATDHEHDLVGGPFAVIESDPGVFTTLIRKLGVRGLAVTELYSVEPFATDHLNPHGLIFCYLCEEDTSAKPEFTAEDDLDDPDARSIWFANQLSDDACSSQAILNVLLNCQGVDLGPVLKEFAADTEKMSPVMRGLAMSNSSQIREAQNSLARPSDLRGAWHSLATTALESAKTRAKATASPPAKKRKTSTASSSRARRSKSARTPAQEKVESYHYIGYVPAHGRVWELDGLRTAGPLDVGPIHSDSDIPPEGEESGSNSECARRAGWMDVVRPALQRRMHAVLGDAGEGHIQYNLLAIVDDAYLRASDALELLKRERAALERRLAERFPSGWGDKLHAAVLRVATLCVLSFLLMTMRCQVDGTLLACASETFATTLRPRASEPGRVFAADFGAWKMAREMAILDMPERALVPAWEMCVRRALEAKVAVEEEIAKAQSAQADHVKRTFDYEPFIREFITALQNEGLLDEVLDGRSVQTGNAEAEATGVAGTSDPSSSMSKAKAKARRKRG
ncbi:cysteine proteinase [Dichomitus squalens]|uniref:ubiquitinyl hydrolase 1 n=1 Tax=Dichomitus squalens TaxID=114155 RepID=A0A4Q9M6W0_9APHY|nr:cysteine proteinase [Dichomitus squalens]